MINLRIFSVRIFFIVLLGLSSCAQPQPEAARFETIQPSQTSVSHTPTPALTFTQSVTPSTTVTATLTPDFSPPIATKTLLTAADCPPANQNIIPEFGDFENSLPINALDDLEKTMEQAKNDIQTYLTTGGTTEKLKRTFQQKQNKQNPDYLGNVELGDITGDHVPEVFVWIALPGSEAGLPSPLTIDWIREFFPMPVLGARTYVYTCNQREYDFLGTLIQANYGDAAMPSLADLNADGVSEIVQPIYDFAGFGHGIHIFILNWNGSEFTDSLHGELREDYMSSFSEGAILDSMARVRSGSYSLQDIDNNGTTEVIISSYDLRGGVACEMLYRETKMILMWNGDHFIGFYQRTPPVYRIQAVWDGDHASLQGLSDRALSAYHQALEDKSLLPWSRDYQKQQYPLCSDIPDSTSIPANAVPDKDEAPRLEAYSLYRIMLLKIIQGDLTGAEDTYALLQEKYQNSYQELAKIFWSNYVSTKSVHEACNATVAYAEANHEQILNPLGWYTYGNPTSHVLVYLPEDICPYQ